MAAPASLKQFAPVNVPRFLTVLEVAGILSCTPSHVANLIEAGKIIAANVALTQKSKAVYRVPPAALEHFLESASTFHA